MYAHAARRFRLSHRYGLDCTADGLTLAGVPLLRQTALGLAPRDAAEIRGLLKAAYGDAVEADRVVASLDPVARALNERQVSRAMIGALLLNLPELDWEGAARLARAEDRLAKFDPDEARDRRGRWAANGNTARTAPSQHGLPPRLSRPPIRLVSDTENWPPRAALVIPRGAWTESQKTVLSRARERAGRLGIDLTITHY